MQIKPIKTYHLFNAVSSKSYTVNLSRCNITFTRSAFYGYATYVAAPLKGKVVYGVTPLLSIVVNFFVTLN